MKLKRRWTTGTFLCLLLAAGLFFCGPLQASDADGVKATLGFAVDGSGPFTSSEPGVSLAGLLAGRLAQPVRVRSFADEAQLFNWMARFQEVDIAWLSQRFLAGVPAGQLYPLAEGQGASAGRAQGAFVAHQGVSAELRREFAAALLSIQDDASGRQLLDAIGIARLVAPGAPERPRHAAVAVAARPEPAPAEAPAAQVAPGRQGQEMASLPETERPAAAATEQAEPPPVAAPAAATGQVEPTPVASPAPAPAQTAPVVSEVPASGETIALVADYLAYNSEEDSYEARGDVVLQRGGVELETGELLWQAATQDAAASGGFKLTDAGTEVAGERLQYNMATGQGQVHAGRVLVREGNFHLAGEQVEKRGDADYFVRRGSFTTCDGEIPDWKFSASEVDVTLGGYARARNVWFHVKDVPVLYTPYLFFPVKTERESGLLTPSFGYSNNKGGKASLAWYQVLDSNMDATLYLDYLSEVGLGKGLEYRYALAGRNEGEALYYHVTGISETPDDFYMAWRHSGTLPGGWRLNVDAEYAEDRVYFNEFGQGVDEYSRDTTLATLVLQRNWQKLNLVGHARYIHDLETDNDTTLQRLPELGLALTRYRIGDTPLYAGLESYATRFRRDSGDDGERLYLKPTLSAVFKPGDWLEVVPQVALHERLYNADAQESEQALPELSLGLATRLTRDFDLERWGIQRLRHSIEPQVAYLYIPDEDQDSLPLFDRLDRIAGRNEIAYALVNRLTARSVTAGGVREYRDLMTLRLSQSYALDESSGAPQGEDRPFSAVRVELEASPTKHVSLDADGSFPVYGGDHVSRLSFGAQVGDGEGNAVRADYTYRNAELDGEPAEYARLQMDTALFKPVYAHVEGRYDFNVGRELEKTVGLEYRAKCWSLFLEYRNRYSEVGADDHEFMVTFVLAGLGQGDGFGAGKDALRE